MIKLLCTNKLKSGPEFDMIQKFSVQINWPFEMIEFQSKKKAPHEITKDETAFFNKHIDSDATLIALDELGKNLKSTDFADLIKTEFNQSNKLCFIIGGANGIAPEIRKRANMLLSFGKATWPHVLCRVMLVEQIYRAQAILSNHPYHREGAL